MVKVIFLADIVGKIGRKAVMKQLPILKKKYKSDLVLANVENLAHGLGFTDSTLKEMAEAGVDVFTSGNHAWDKAGSDEILDSDEYKILRPANYLDLRSGSGASDFSVGSQKVTVINLLGQVFMKEEVDSPFEATDGMVKKRKSGDIVIVDFHAEATSEKVALAQYLDGKVSAVIGTHTHVPTCDQRILDNGTATVTDAGMIGYYDSVIGAGKEQVLDMFLGSSSGSKKHDLPDEGTCQFNAIYLEFNKRGKTEKIERIDKLVNIK